MQVTAITAEISNTHTHTHTHTHINSVIKSNVPGQPGLYRETLSEKTITKRKPKNKNPMCLHDQNSIVNSTRRIICLKHKSGVGTSWPWKHIHTHGVFIYKQLHPHLWGRGT